ncbi:Lgmn [Symbiodinium necroappetens]|uniref:Lgmn protein n=1 Tax=Symbiodinium necroappetens TaxID=1628268 RepID=A0A812VV92_9DINO|nr:Lgmn [Symbiodinium necroappetens]
MAPCPDNGWQYIDPSGNIQGPFPIEKMRVWHRHNFFYAELLMRSDPVVRGFHWAPHLSSTQNLRGLESISEHVHAWGIFGAQGWSSRLECAL